MKAKSSFLSGPERRLPAKDTPLPQSGLKISDGRIERLYLGKTGYRLAEDRNVFGHMGCRHLWLRWRGILSDGQTLRSE
jgi:hypothetical protein